MRDLGRLMLLFDFYGDLLTARQRQAFELHFGQDLSLAEMAEELHVSRPGALDLIQRAQRTLDRAEASVGAVGRHLAERRMLSEVVALLRTGDRAAVGRALGMVEAWLDEGGDGPV